MTFSDYDEELERAIALSLQQDSTKQSNREVIDLESPEDRVSHPNHEVINIEDSEDEDLRRAIAMSLREVKQDGDDAQSAGPSNVDNATIAKPPNLVPPDLDYVEAAAPSSSSQPSKSAFGLPGLDRKAMEQERLARLAKRKRSGSPETAPNKTARKKDYFGGYHEPRMAALSKKVVDGAVDALGKLPVTGLSPIQYPQGTIKRTWAFKHPRTNDIKIEEVLQADTCTTAVLSAFEFDDTWLFSKLDPRKTKQIWVMNAKGEHQVEFRRQAAESNTPIVIHFPNMKGQIQSMHSKFMLLFHPTHLRMAVPTANFTYVDWGETPKDRNGQMHQGAVMENSVFIIDLPRRSDNGVGQKDDLTFFGKELLYFIEALGLSKPVCDSLLKFDYSATKHIAFVHSIGGSHKPPERERTGLLGLRRAVQALDLNNVKAIQLDYAASSIGHLNDRFLSQFYHAAAGTVTDSIITTEGPLPYVRDNIRIYFPLHNTVINSTGGSACGGTNTLSPSYYNAEDFPKQCMRDYTSTRPGVLSHNKLLLVRGLRTEDRKPFAWAYVGSANVSESAWGKRTGAGLGPRGGPPKIHCRNWECGVLVPVQEEVFRYVQLEDGNVPGMEVFKGTLELPFQYPGEPYGTKRPWFFRSMDY
ncbi:phospholipase D/nuclease [Delitschia confertaspora ATCC 74209]|uniref:Phospholipase D/nuclease n=1 Tax=Delitschia confertaspora ATCC 74209 TaxID=1513339 RepID=A0A9P4JEL7_9PLEO|nr:phospholipase D/nuclease [Delitschia confertaspora ATCC 74209]